MNATRRSATLLPAILALALVSDARAADAPAAAAKPTAKETKKPAVRVTISKETTYVTEPLRPDGYVDYIAAIKQRFGQGVTAENNAAVLFWKARGPADIHEKLRDRYFKLLGVPPLPLDGPYYVPLEAFAKRAKPAVKPEDAEKTAEAQEKLWKDQSEAMRRPWSGKEFPLLAGWIEANEKPIALMVEGTKRPRCYEPLIADEPAMVIAILLPAAQQSREMARVLAARAMLRLESGRVDDAWEDLLACHRLARLVGQGPTLIESLVGIAIEGIACAGDQALIRHPGLTAAQARRFYDELGRLAPVSRMADQIDFCERCMFLDAVQMMAREGPGSLSKLDGVSGGTEGAVQKTLSTLASYAIDWDLILRMGNSWYDRMVAACRKPTRAERKAALDAIDKDIKDLVAKAKDPKAMAWALLGSARQVASERIGQVLVALLLPAIGHATEAEDRGRMLHEVTRLGFALAAYKADRGAYPAKLADLSPTYVAKIPQDIFSGRDLVYRRHDRGFLLYSVGVNGRDDGGLSYDDRSEDQPAKDFDDLVVQVPAKKPAEKRP
jgi:hypothetical protein